MDFMVKIVVLLLFLVEVYGKSIRLEDGTGNATGVNTIVLPEACEFNGIFHPLDSVFAAPDNPCLVCECNEYWTGTISDASCHEVECDELDDTKLNDGCIPVYDETKCCVIDFYCRDNVATNTTEGIENDNEIENGNDTEENDEVVCPTPICADESCRIEIPPGQFCPTCICEGFKEKNDFESPELSERHPLEAQNASEDMEFFLIPVPWSGVSDGAVPQEGNTFKEESDYDGDSERVEVSKPQALDHGNGDRVPREIEYADSSINVIDGGMEAEPRRKRSINSQTALTSSPQQQQQQRWTVLQDDTQNIQQSSDSDERERENSDDSSEDYGEMKILSQGESETADSTNEISDLYDEESVVWEKIVPGCPTPLCENSGCRIGIPPGHQCPTCICNRRIRQP